MILHESSFHNAQFVSSQYGEEARNFSETLEFISNLGWVTVDDGTITFTESGSAISSAEYADVNLARRILGGMRRCRGYDHILADYLVQFEIVDREIAQTPSTGGRIRESPIRNFLMDMRVVSYDSRDDRFVLDRCYADLYLWAKNILTSKVKGRFEQKLRQREEFGLSAEYAVFDYEKNRVGTQLSDQVRHISAEMPFASYDIESVTETQAGITPRIIEVKAVPADSYEFFWTHSEIEAAKILTDQYFLYLLPFANGMFDFSRLVVLQNPYETVYENTDSWYIENVVISCRRKHQGSSSREFESN